MCVHAPRVCLMPVVTQDLLEPELWVGVSFQEGDQPWVSGKSSECSSELELSQQPLNVCLKIEKSTLAGLRVCYNE